MKAGTILQIIMVATGISLFFITTNSLAKRKMTESFCLAWGLISVVLIFAGIFLRPVGWSDYLSNMGIVLVLMIGYSVLYVAYFLSSRVSELFRKNQELAMQVSLLNQENRYIMKQLEQLTGESVKCTSKPPEYKD